MLQLPEETNDEALNEALARDIHDKAWAVFQKSVREDLSFRDMLDRVYLAGLQSGITAMLREQKDAATS